MSHPDCVNVPAATKESGQSLSRKTSVGNDGHWLCKCGKEVFPMKYQKTWP